MTKAQLLSILDDTGACAEAVSWVRKSKYKTAAGIWNNCENGSWLLWIAAKLEADRKQLVRAACACAREALKYVKPGEDRPRIAIETAERWTRGEATIEEVRAAAAAADAAAADAAAYGVGAYAAYAAAAADDAADAADAAYDAYDAAYARNRARAESLKRSAEIVRAHFSFSDLAKLAKVAA